MILENLIERGQYWTDSLTLVSGCSAVSEGCEHCWSAAMASRFPWGKRFAENGKWTGKVAPNYKALEKLEKRAVSTRKLKPRVWQIWNDLLHPALPNEFRQRCWKWMALCDIRHRDVFLILTKRPELIGYTYAQPPGFYIGVSVESQKHVGRIDQLIQNWPGKKFVSIEPCLGAVDLEPYIGRYFCPSCNRHFNYPAPVDECTQCDHRYTANKDGAGEDCPKCGCDEYEHICPTCSKSGDEMGLAENESWRYHSGSTSLDQVIIGGESGPKARPMHPDWARLVRDQCVKAEVPFYLKQRGQWLTADEVAEYCGDDTPILRDTWPSRINRNIDRGRLQLVDNTTMCRVTKEQAGRLLDGRHWDQLAWNQTKEKK